MGRRSERLRTRPHLGRDGRLAALLTLAQTLEPIADTGTAWDAELEPYRAAGEDTPVRVLHHVV